MRFVTFVFLKNGFPKIDFLKHASRPAYVCIEYNTCIVYVLVHIKMPYLVLFLVSSRQKKINSAQSKKTHCLYGMLKERK